MTFVMWVFFLLLLLYAAQLKKNSSFGGSLNTHTQTRRNRKTVDKQSTQILATGKTNMCVLEAAASSSSVYLFFFFCFFFTVESIPTGWSCTTPSRVYVYLNSTTLSLSLSLFFTNTFALFVISNWINFAFIYFWWAFSFVPGSLFADS